MHRCSNAAAFSPRAASPCDSGRTIIPAEIPIEFVTQTMARQARLPATLLFVVIMCVVVAAEARQAEDVLPHQRHRALRESGMGTGEPIVIVHGGPVLEHGYLLPHLAPLAESYELVFFDQRLSGRSAPSVSPESVRLDTFVEDIEALRVSLDLGRIHLLAHSWGGLLAMRYAVEHNEHLRSLILLDSMSASSDLWKEEEARVAAASTEADRNKQRAIRESEGFAERKPEAIRQLLLASFEPQFHDRSRVAELDLYVPDDYTARSEQFSALIVDLTSYDFHEELAEITVPTLILYGDAEPGRNLGGAALGRAIPGASMVTMDDAGHFPFIEQPREFLRLVRGFLQKATAAP